MAATGLQLVVNSLLKLYDTQPYQVLHDQYRQLPVGTVGRSVADLLDAQGLQMIPRFESHDLKHVLLGYGMDPEDEVRMQAYLWGNGNHSLTCFLLLSTALLLPDTWPSLKVAYRRGKANPSMVHLTLQACAEMSLKEVRAQYLRE